ncbi:MAG: ABC transporter ATP-binding protein [Bdellovibrionales bacterium]
MSEPVVSLRHVNLYFTASLYRSASWRDVFVRAIKRGDHGLAERLHVCRNISFDIQRGDRVALIGTNGAGKTSLCRCIAGLYQPTSGEILRHGEIRALFEPATVVQPELTGRENAWLLSQLLFPGEDVEREVEDALEFSELGRFLDAPLRTYSKGMLARLGLSLAALKPADLLILDEVFDGADVFFREKISRRMIHIVEKSGAVIFISHSPDQIRRVCNRLLYLHNGEIIFDGDVEKGLALFATNSRPAETPEPAELPDVTPAFDAHF